ncbi:MAG: DUF2695 domain-containing protein [Planctomycetota bacterium]
MSRSKKERQQAAIREYARRRNAARESSPLSAEQLDELWNYVALRYSANGHDGTLTMTNTWLTMINADVSVCIDFLADHNIKSDFDVVTNCDPRQLFGTTDGKARRMPLTYGQLNELLDHLADTVPSVGCNHDYTQTELWLKIRDLSPWQTTMAFSGLGAFCDCEIVLNIEPCNIFSHSSPNEDAG